MRKFFLLFSFGLLIILAAIGFLLIPRNYDVEPFTYRDGTEFWDLNTGSKIGYSKITGDLPHKDIPIIYLHGGPGGIITDETIQNYSFLQPKGYTTYFYDQIGSGHSERLDHIEEYSVQRHTQDLHAIIEEIAAEKVILIGQSWGACLAMNYLMDHPHKVEKIVLTSPGPILPRKRGLEKINPPDSLSMIAPQFSNRQGNEKAHNLKTKMVARFAYAFNFKLASDEEMDDFFTFLNQELSKSIDCVPKENRIIEGGGGFYSHIMTANKLDLVVDKRKELAKLSTPLLIIKGQCDNQKWGYTQEYLDLFQNTQLEVIEGLGHDVFNSENKQAVQLISEFL